MPDPRRPGARIVTVRLTVAQVDMILAALPGYYLNASMSYRCEYLRAKLKKLKRSRDANP